MLAATFITKGGSFGAQIVLGWILLKEDFGVYAIAISVSSLVQVLKDGGTRKIIVQKGERRFGRLCPAVFWMALGFNLLTALTLLFIAMPVARIYEEPLLIPILIVLASATVLGTPDTMFRAWLSVQLRFRDLARLQTIIGLVRSLSMILLAVSGAGVMSFAWPALIAAISGWLIGRWMCGPLPIWGSIRFRLWPILLHSSVWMFVGSGALMMLRQGPYMILGLNHEAALIGVYFFAFQLLLQINQLIATNFQSVLLPALSTIGHQTKRHAHAVVRSSGALAFIGSAFAMGVCVGIGDVVRVVWGDKWVDAIPAIQWMGLFFPFRMLQSIFEPAMISRGLYRKWAMLVILQSVVVFCATMIASLCFLSAADFAMVIGAGFFVSMILAGSIGAKMIGVKPIALAGATLPTWFIGAVLYACTLYARNLLEWNTSQSTILMLMHGILSGGVFVAMYIVVLRLLIPNTLVGMLDMIPRRYSVYFERLLKLQLNTRL